MDVVINTVEDNDRKYEMMNGGINSQAFQVLAAIGLNLFNVQRFRDAGYDKHRRRIWVLTRTGSKSHFPDKNNRHLEENQYFLKRYDEPMDASYEILLFNCPKDAMLRHASLPDLALILKNALERQETGNLNELEKDFEKKIIQFAKLLEKRQKKDPI